MGNTTGSAPHFAFTLTEFSGDGDRDAVRSAVAAMQIAIGFLDIPAIEALTSEAFVYIDHAGSQHGFAIWLDSIRRLTDSERRAGIVVQDILVSGGLALVTGYLQGMPHPLPVPAGSGHGAQSAQTWGLLDGSWRRLVLRQPRP